MSVSMSIGTNGSTRPSWFTMEGILCGAVMVILGIAFVKGQIPIDVFTDNAWKILTILGTVRGVIKVADIIKNGRGDK